MLRCIIANLCQAQGAPFTLFRPLMVQEQMERLNMDIKEQMLTSYC